LKLINLEVEILKQIEQFEEANGDWSIASRNHHKAVKLVQ